MFKLVTSIILSYIIGYILYVGVQWLDNKYTVNLVKYFRMMVSLPLYTINLFGVIICFFLFSLSLVLTKLTRYVKIR